MDQLWYTRCVMSAVYESWSNICFLTGFSELRTALIFLSQEQDFFSSTLVVFLGFHLGLTMAVAQYTLEILCTRQNRADTEMLITTAEILFYMEERKYHFVRTATDMLYSSAIPGTSGTSRPSRTSRPKRCGRSWTKGTMAVRSSD